MRIDMRRMRHRASAFTMIELLVVIAIVAVLLAILLSSVNAARQSAQTVACLTNLRQIGTAITAYSLEWENYIVPGYAGTQMSGTAGHLVDAENYATLLVKLRLLPAPPTATLTSDSASTDNVFKCPAGREEDPFEFSTGNSSLSAREPADRRDPAGARPWRTISQSTGMMIDTWYGINATNNNFDAQFQPARRIPAGVPVGTARDNRLNRLTRIAQPSKMVILYDGVFMHPHRDADRINARHKSRTITNLLFLDGHAASFATGTLIGGMGPNASGVDVFTPANLARYPDQHWLTNQR